MRLQAILAVAIAASAVAGSASATGSWGGASSKNAVLTCHRVTVTKTVLVKGKKYFPGVLVRIAKPEADKLIAAKKAAALNETAWKGRLFCLIDLNGAAIPDQGGAAPAPTPAPAPGSTPAPPPAPAPAPTPTPTPPSHDDHDDDRDERPEPPEDPDSPAG